MLERYLDIPVLNKEINELRMTWSELNEPRSPISGFAEVMFADAANSLYTIFLPDIPSTSRPTQTSLRREAIRNRHKNVALVYMASTFISVEEMIRKGHYAHHEFCSTINEGLGLYGERTKTLLPIAIEPPQKLSNRTMSQIVNAAADDPTLTQFLVYGSELLPKRMWDEINRPEVIENINLLRHTYKHIARELVTPFARDRALDLAFSQLRAQGRSND